MTAVDDELRPKGRSRGVVALGRDPLIAVAFLVAASRVLARMRGGFEAGVNFDEGAYLSAAAMFARGHTPYRDFVLAHPPGLTVVMAPLTLFVSPSNALVLGRLLATVMGAASAWLIGDITRRHAPVWAAAVAMGLYAVMPEVAQVERSVLVEPLLNLTCLLAVWRWTAAAADGRAADRRAWQTGILLAVALVVKSWAVLLVVPVLLTATAGRRRRDVTRVLVGLSAGAVAMLGPFLLWAGGDMVEQTVQFQLLRTSDGASLSERAAHVLGFGADSIALRSLPVTALAVGSLVTLLLSSRWNRTAVLAATWYGFLVVAFLSASNHLAQYNAHMGPPVALLAGAAVPTLYRRWFTGEQRSWSAANVSVVAVALALVAVGVAGAGRNPPPDWTPLVATIVRDDLPADTTGEAGDCTFSFEPGWLIAGDQWPDIEAVGPVGTDPFAGLLGVAVETGEAGSGLRGAAVVAATTAVVDRCDRVLVGTLGTSELEPPRLWFERTYRQVRVTLPNGPELWVRREPRAG